MMPRYIDADKLIKHLEESVEECGNPDVDAHPVAYGTVLGLNGALSYARTLLATDVAKVVRCEDCKWYAPNNNGSWYGCAIDTRSPDDIPNPTDFCSYGERKK